MNQLFCLFLQIIGGGLNQHFLVGKVFIAYPEKPNPEDVSYFCSNVYVGGKKCYKNEMYDYT